MSERDDLTRPLLMTNDGRTSVRLTLGPPERAFEDDSFIVYDIEVRTDDFECHCGAFDFADGGELVPFLEGLAEQFRGWDGVRSWKSLESQFGIDATWGSLGHVTLAVWVTPRSDAPWEIRATFTVEAGAQMQTLANDLALHFART